jgi:hypothetical protein
MTTLVLSREGHVGDAALLGSQVVNASLPLAVCGPAARPLRPTLRT